MTDATDERIAAALAATEGIDTETLKTLRVFPGSVHFRFLYSEEEGEYYRLATEETIERMCRHGYKSLR